MAQKPTHEELEQKILELEKEAVKRKQAEAQITDWKHRYEAAILASGHLLYDWNSKTDEVAYGGDLKNMLGYSYKEMKGGLARWIELVHPKDRSFFEQAIEHLKTKVETAHLKYRVRKKDGNYIFVEDNGHFITDAQGNAVQMIGFVKDVTDRVLAEKTLKEREKKYRLLVESTADWVWSCDLEGRQTFSNQAIKTILGYEVHEIEGLSYESLLHPEDHRKIRNWFKNAIENKAGWEKSVLRWRHKDGTIKFLESTAKPTLGAEANLTGFIGIDRDITDRRQAEEILKERTKTLNDILEKAADGICVCHNISEQPYVKFTHWNPRMTEITGYTIEEINQSGWYQLMYPDPELQRKAIERMAAMRKGDDIQAEEWEIKTKSGEKKSLSMSTSIVDEKDERVHVLALMQDITERKKTEEALRASEGKYRFLAENMVDIVWTIDPNFRTTYVSPSIEKVLGFTAEERKQQTLEEMITPGSLQNVQMKFMEELQREEDGVSDPDRSVTMEVEYYRKNLSTVWMENTMSAIRGPDGAIVGIHGVSRDIAERKKAEKALRQAHDQLERRVRERTEALETQKRSLEDVNTALNVMLKKREEDRLKIEERVLFNVKQLIEPLIENLKKSGLDDSQTGYVDTLETFLAEIVSPFSQTLHTRYLNLTLSEIRVANLIKEGKTTKEIARLLNSTPRAIEFHRQNLRKKLGLSNRKVNLASHILHLLK